MKSSAKNEILETKMQQNERIYRDACGVFGGEPHVFRYYDQTDEISVDLLTVEDVPTEGIVSYSTLGLIHYPVGQRSGKKPRRVELAGACHKKFEYFPNLLSTCSFDVMNARFNCQNGSVYKDVVNTYLQGSPMKHVLFVTASRMEAGFFVPPWETALPELDFEDKNVIWLCASAISDAELGFLEQEGLAALLELLRDKGADPCDWDRGSVL